MSFRIFGEAGFNLLFTKTAESAKGLQHISDCPFCGRANHFFVNEDNTKWDCKLCGLNGNSTTFFRLVYEQGLSWRDASSEGPPALEALAASRGIPKDSLEWAGVSYNVVDSRWLLPMYNAEGALSNLGMYDETGSIKGVRYLPDEPQTLFGLEQPEAPHVVVLEGPWDRPAYHALLSQCREGKRPNGTKGYFVTDDPDKSLWASGQYQLLATPAAGTWKPEWTAYLAKRRSSGSLKSLTFIYDNDHARPNEKTGVLFNPGWDGVRKAALACYNALSVAKDNFPLRVCKWGEDLGADKSLKSGYDVRDAGKEKAANAALTLIHSRLVPYSPTMGPLTKPKPGVKAGNASAPSTTVSSRSGRNAEGPRKAPVCVPIKREKFAHLLEDFDRAKFIMTPSLETAFLSMAATNVSTPLAGDTQIWLRVMGAPGSGKTTLCEAFAGAEEYIKSVSKLTGIHSGFSENGNHHEDNSLIWDINGRSLVMKDADTLLTAPNLSVILAELRDLYDSYTRLHYRNKKKHEYEGLRNTMIFCGTGALRALDKSFLGERFLNVQISVRPDMARRIEEQAFDNAMAAMDSDPGDEGQSITLVSKLRPYVYGFLKHKHESIKAKRLPEVSAPVRTRLMAMGRLTAMMRAQVNENLREMGYTTDVEAANRLIGQFARLPRMLAYMLDQEGVEGPSLHHAAEIARASCAGWPFEISKLILKHGPLTRLQISTSLNIPDASLRRSLSSMTELGLATENEVSNNSGLGGRKAKRVQLSPALSTVLKEAAL